MKHSLCYMKWKYYLRKTSFAIFSNMTFCVSVMIFWSFETYLGPKHENTACRFVILRCYFLIKKSQPAEYLSCVPLDGKCGLPLKVRSFVLDCMQQANSLYLHCCVLCCRSAHSDARNMTDLLSNSLSSWCQTLLAVHDQIFSSIVLSSRQWLCLLSGVVVFVGGTSRHVESLVCE